MDDSSNLSASHIVELSLFDMFDQHLLRSLEGAFASIDHLFRD
jgi:hypothetical protein